MGPSDGRPDENFLKWSSRTACNLRGTISGTRCVAQFMRTGWAMQLGCETWSATQARTRDPLCVRRPPHRRCGHVRRGLHSQDVASRTTRPTCSREPLDTVGPSDGHSDETFQKWSSRTPCSLRGTTNGMRRVTHFEHER